MEAVKFMRYEGNNYFWINDLEPKMIMHPNYTNEDKHEWYDTNGLVNYADPTGKKLFVEFVKVARASVRDLWITAGQSRVRKMKNQSPRSLM